MARPTYDQLFPYPGSWSSILYTYTQHRRFKWRHVCSCGHRTPWVFSRKTSNIHLSSHLLWRHRLPRYRSPFTL